MDVVEKKDALPIAEDFLNVHDLFAGSGNAIVKQEPLSDSDPESGSHPPDVKDVLNPIVESNGTDSEAASSEATEFFCTLCRRQISKSVPKVFVATDIDFHDVVREILLTRYCKWRVDFALTGLQPKVICLHHLEAGDYCVKKVALWKKICMLCGNKRILQKYTTLIPFDPEEQKVWREKITGASFSVDRLEKVLASVQQRSDGMETMRVCTDHFEACEFPEGAQTSPAFDANPVDFCSTADSRRRFKWRKFLRDVTVSEEQTARLVGNGIWERIRNEEREQFEGWRVVADGTECETIDIRKALELEREEDKRKRRNERERELYHLRKKSKLEQKRKEDEQREWREEKEVDEPEKTPENTPEERSMMISSSITRGDARIERRERRRKTEEGVREEL